MSSKPESTTSATAAPKSRFFIGLMAGLVGGTLLAVAVALYISHLATPIPSHSATPALPTQSVDHPTLSDATKRGMLTPSPVSGPDVPDATPKSPEASVNAPTPSSDPLRSLMPPSSTLPALPENRTPLPMTSLPEPLNDELHPVTVRYFIQTGAFEQSSEAESQRANLALLGIDSTILPSDVTGKPTYYRVRIGPFASVDEVRTMVKTLKDNNLPAQVLRETTTSHSSLIPH